jgi:hypothetical protein
MNADVQRKLNQAEFRDPLLNIASIGLVAFGVGVQINEILIDALYRRSRRPQPALNKRISWEVYQIVTDISRWGILWGLPFANAARNTEEERPMRQTLWMRRICQALFCLFIGTAAVITLTVLSFPLRQPRGADVLGSVRLRIFKRGFSDSTQGVIKGSYGQAVLLIDSGETVEFTTGPVIFFNRENITAMDKGNRMDVGFECGLTNRWRTVCTMRSQTISIGYKLRVELRVELVTADGNGIYYPDHAPLWKGFKEGVATGSLAAMVRDSIGADLAFSYEGHVVVGRVKRNGSFAAEPQN